MAVVLSAGKAFLQQVCGHALLPVREKEPLDSLLVPDASLSVMRRGEALPLQAGSRRVRSTTCWPGTSLLF